MSTRLGEPVSTDEFNEAWQTVLEGRYAGALERWNQFIACDPRPVRFKTARGITLLLLGRHDAALADFLEVRKGWRPANFPVEFVGVALWLQGEPEAACDDWNYEISRRRSGEVTHADDAGGVQVPALLWWASAHPGLQQWRQSAVGELRRRWRTKRCRQSIWPGPAASLLLGKDDDERTLAAAADLRPFQARKRCQAHFYLGAHRLNAGDLAGYRERLSLATNQGDNSIGAAEYHLAHAELRALS